MEFPKAETVRESIDKFKEETALKKRMEQEQLIRDAIEYMIENHHSSFCIDGIDFDDVDEVVAKALEDAGYETSMGLHGVLTISV